jgi:hypothetical protein
MIGRPLDPAQLPTIQMASLTTIGQLESVTCINNETLAFELTICLIFEKSLASFAFLLQTFQIKMAMFIQASDCLYTCNLTDNETAVQLSGLHCKYIFVYYIASL